jgi:Flp pilus assembly protein TadD
MAYASRSRRSMILALLASTAAASLLGACGQTPKLFSRDSEPAEVKMSAAEAANATSQWARAYLKNPQDPQMALGYARSLKAIGAKDQSLEVLKAAYRANPKDGEIAAELGRVALDMNRVDIAGPALQTAEAQGVDDWKTLSAQGTLFAKKGEHDAAQKYFQAALQKKPDSAAVINNLALSYALDGKAKKSEELLRKAVANGQDDKRIRQNLAMVLGLQGKFSEARQVASVDMTDTQAKASMSYLRNMLSAPTQVAAAEPQAPRKPQPSASDWSPFGYDDSEEKTAPAKAPATTPAPIPVAMANTPPKPEVPKVQVVKPVDEIESPITGEVVKETKTATSAAAPSAPKFAQAAVSAPPTRTKIIKVPETNGPRAEAKPATATSTVAKTETARPTKAATAAAPAEVAQAEMVIPITPPPSTKSDKLAGAPAQRENIAKADLR